MKYIIAALLIVLAVQALPQTDLQEAEATSIIQKIENSKFGATLLDTIQLQLEAGDPVQDLINMLRSIEATYQKEQQEDDQFIESLQVECDDDIARLLDEIKAAKERVAELKAELDEKIPIRDTKVRQVAEKRNFAALIQSKIVELDQRKTLKDEEWREEQEQHSKAAAMIQNAKDIISRAMKNQNNFLETNKLQTTFAELSNHLTTNLKKANFQRKSWNSIFRLLAQIASSAPVQADQSAVNKIIEICDKLLDKIADSRELERRDYQHYVDEYNNARTALNERLDKTNLEIDQLDSEISTLNRRISAAQDEKAEQEKRAIEKKQQHDDKLKFCEDENRNYAERREKRDGDREVVSDCIGLFQSQLRLFRQYVSNRTKSVQKAN